ncbi:MAG: glycoside hydrolase family 16 protein, partial [Acidimicrobiia bacterium]|nr:glycoside hydrolase family 16 protein [Acidimicrobiia bacterium]
ITARREPAANLWDPTDVRPLSTGQVSTTQTFDHGTFEVRVRHEAGANLAQAVWMLPYPLRWPPEIDIVETRLSVDPATAFFNAYSGTPDAPLDEPTFVDFDEPLDGRWVTYRLVWEGATMAWYVDGELVRSQETDVAGVPMRLILDQSWIVPWSGDGPVSAQLPVSLEIDYVRIWQ